MILVNNWKMIDNYWKRRYSYKRLKIRRREDIANGIYYGGANISGCLRRGD